MIWTSEIQVFDISSDEFLKKEKLKAHSGKKKFTIYTIYFLEFLDIFIIILFSY